MARLPLDTAAYAGSLIAIDRLTTEPGLNGCTEIATCDRLVVTGAAVIELSMVGQMTILIKKIELWGAGRAIGLRDLLRLVVTEGEFKPQTYGHFLQSRWCILGIVDGISAADGDDSQIRLLIVMSELSQLMFDMYHIGTVPADEHDEQPCPCRKRVKRVALPSYDVQ